ncbi:MAG: FAD-binding protein [Flavobacteriales bacterium]|nr:FAD-binding protein [Flavobacteriales bacterium]
MSKPHVFTNWARTHRSYPENYFQPISEQEVVGLVKRASAASRKIRVVGAGHSWSSIVCTDSWLVNLDGLNAVIKIDQISQQVTVQGGMRLKELNEVLTENGLALQNLGSISEQSIAGVISTATHGSSMTHGILATQVRAFKIVDGNGNVHVVDPGQGDLWRARVSLGCLGIITEVTLQCREAFDLKESMYPVPLKELDETMLDLAKANEYFKIWWFPHVDAALVYCYNTTTESRVNHRGFMRWLDDNFLATYVFTFILGIGKVWPALVPFINRFIKILKFQETVRIDKSDRVLNVSMPPIHNEMEWAIDVKDTPEAFKQVRNMIDDRNLKINFILEIRFVKGDDCLLSPCHSRDSAYIGAYHAGEKGWAAYVEGFEEIMRQFEGRPHWGKHFTFDKNDIKSLYPDLHLFNKIRGQLDPHDMFVNDFIRNTII